jgi:hypothetical protein
MNSRATWIWLFIAASLFAFIALYQRKQHVPPPGPLRVLPSLTAARITSIQVRPAGPGQLRIGVVRTNQNWLLTEPLKQPVPAQSASIEHLLKELERLTAVIYLAPNEIRGRASVDEEFGFAAPQASLFLQEGEAQIPVIIGSHTPPGDQVYLQVVGDQGVYVVDAKLLDAVPRSANDWRDTTLIHLAGLSFDRLAITNNAKAEPGASGVVASSSKIILQREATNSAWRMAFPLLQARADSLRIEDSLRRLQAVRIQQFVSDDPKAGLEEVGLAPPALELAFSVGTNTVAWLQFGSPLTNDSSLVYARRVGLPTVFAVPKEALDPWRGKADDFRDPHLVSLGGPVQAIEVEAQDAFRLERETNDLWRVQSQTFPVDQETVKELLGGLSGMRIIQFVKEAVTPAELPDFGLSTPLRQYTLLTTNLAPATVSSNAVLVDLDFGTSTNQPERVFARRTDESSVYAVGTNDFARLPSASWEFRERKFWGGWETNVARLLIRQGGKIRQLVRDGAHAWSLAPGSQGVINDLAIEETVRGVLQANAAAWVARGKIDRARFGFPDEPFQLSFELTNGSRLSIEFGGEAPSSNCYAATTLDGETWVMEFPWVVFRDVLMYLSIPSNS